MANEKTALAIVPRTLDEVTSLADVFSKSGLLPDALKGKTPDIVVSILAGQELGLPPMASIRGVHVVQGKPVISADTMVGLILGSGLAEYFVQVEASHTSVTYETKRKGSPIPQRCTWTFEDAKKAGLNTKDNWRLHTRQMLAARAKSELARAAYPDVLAGCYDHDEIAVPVQSTAPVAPVAPVERHNDAIDVEYTEVVELPEFVEMDKAETLDQLQAIVPKLANLTGATKKAARARYSANLARLESPPVTNGVNSTTTTGDTAS